MKVLLALTVAFLALIAVTCSAVVMLFGLVQLPFWKLRELCGHAADQLLGRRVR
jgi:hypothetical protein